MAPASGRTEGGGMDRTAWLASSNMLLFTSFLRSVLRVLRGLREATAPVAFGANAVVLGYACRTSSDAKIAFWKKANLISLFFLLRKLILPFYSFTLVCIILPMTMFVPEAELPDWVVCYIPALMSFLNILPAPKYFPFIIPYLLFQNTMSVTKFNAMIYGLFQLGSAYEWVVTKKSDRSLEGDLIALAPKGLKQRKAGSTPILDAAAMKEQYTPKQSALRKEAKKKNNRTCKKGLALSLLLLAAAAAARILLSKQGIHFYFMLFQGLSFLPVGLDLIGEDVN